MLIVGLTGNYGMGKSTVLEAFRELGAFTISSDRVVADILEEKPVLEEIRRIFGPWVFDLNGGLLKKRLARTIFMDNGLRAKLEGLLHPLVFENIDETLRGVREDMAVIEVPLIFEKGYEKRFTKTVTVYAEYTTVLKRLKEKGISREDILLRHVCQMPVVEKIKRSDFVIDNNGAMEETLGQVRGIYEKLAALQVTG
jgi:dephospho-CoA kinase